MDGDVESLAPGVARCAGPSTRELFLRDSITPPAPLLAESYAFRGDDDIAYNEYLSTDYAADEFDHMWSRTWQWACREEHLPEPGDYVVYDIGNLSALIVRGPDGSIKAFHNVCLHRGTQLKPAQSMGFGTKLRCPFHGWTWSLDGTLVDVPCAWDFPHVDPEAFSLPEINLGLWGGFVFVNFDDKAPSLESYLGVLPEHFAQWDLADRYVELHIRKVLPANWKAALGAFLEAYHVLETHSQSIMVTGDANAQYDVFGEHVSRFMHTVGFPSPHVGADRPTETGVLNMLLSRHPGSEGAVVADGETARDGYARTIQQLLGATYDNDFSHLSVSETIDSLQYFVFPNACFFPGLNIPLVYRFRPDAANVDQCVFEVLWLRPKPRSGVVPEPASPFDLGIDDSYTTVPGIPGSLGVVFDQDTINLSAQTRGFKASKKPGFTLGNYQEVRVRHLHDTVRRYVAEGQSLT
jgi:phenylpropionate dioxygenase-like ring-hydroxylating dioxygenase large terminal subunit